MNLKYNNDGCLFHGIYELSLRDFEDEFVKGKSQRRYDIFENYKHHISEIKETGCCLNHWIDGSFVTLKENPNDIDTLTEFDGLKIEAMGIKRHIDDLIYNAPLRSEGYCHSLVIYKFPESCKKDYDDYIYSKMRVLYLLFPIDSKTGNLKGFIKLNGGN